MKKQIFVRAAASAAVLILLSPLLAGAAAAVQPDVSRNGSGASADAAAGPVRAESPRLSAKSAVLLDASTGRVLYASHAEDKSLIASTTKIMTALVICEAGDLDRTVVIPPEAVGIEGSSMYLKAGEVLSVHELLYGLMLRSGNDAAVALALADSGSISAFAMRMNEKAAVLGLKNTHYANPHGLDSEENYSTALDLARLTRFALQNPDFAQLVSTKSVTIGDRVLTNHNKLLWKYSGAIGVMTAVHLRHPGRAGRLGRPRRPLRLWLLAVFRAAARNRGFCRRANSGYQRSGRLCQLDLAIFLLLSAGRRRTAGASAPRAALRVRALRYRLRHA